MSKRWKIAGAVTILALLGGGVAWAVNSSSSASATPVKAGRPGRGSRGSLPLRRVVHADVDLFADGKIEHVQVNHGIVESVSGHAITLREPGDDEVTVSVGDATRINVNGQDAEVADIRPGMEVFSMGQAGQPARVIRASDPNGRKAPSQSGSPPGQ